MTAAPAVPPHSSRRRGRWIVAALLIVVVAAVAVLLATRATPPSYRLALASRATVDQTLASSGTVSPVDHADLDFAVAGTVATVSATVGQHVTAGQQLAGLDTGTLDATVAQAQAQAAAAQNKLAQDETGQTAGPGSSSGSGSGSGSAGTTGAPAAFVIPGGAGDRVLPVVAARSSTARVVDVAAGRPGTGASATATPGSGPDIPALQAQLLADQHRADGDLAAARRALDSSTSACRTAIAAGGASADTSGSAGSGTSSGSSAPTPTPTRTPNPTRSAAPTVTASAFLTPASTSGSSSGSTSSGTDAIGRCQDDLSASLAAQTTVAIDQTAVATGEAALDQALDRSSPAGPGSSGTRSAPSAPDSPPAGSSGGANPTAPGGQVPGAGGRTGAGAGRPPAAPGAGSAAARGAAPAPSGRASSPTSAPATAEQLAADQAAVDADSAAVATAAQQRDQAVLLSPLDGTVVAVDVSPGQTVTAAGASGPPQISVVGPGGEEVTTTADDTTVASIHPGQAATATPDGSLTPLTGHVVGVGLLPTSEMPASGVPAAASTNGVSYPVTVALDRSPQVVPDGQSAAVSITVAHAADVLTVPTSAVRAVGARHVVTVLRGTRTVPIPIVVGATDPTHTQILDGLQPGDQVVLANLDDPLPTTTSLPGGPLGGGGARAAGGRTGG